MAHDSSENLNTQAEDEILQKRRHSEAMKYTKDLLKEIIKKKLDELSV